VSRILFAWELGGGFGHLGPFRPIAEALLARGHELTVAARDVQSAATVFGALPLEIVQAPLCVKTYNGLAEPPLNFAEILMRYGYFDAPQLSGLLRAWRGLLDIVRPNVLVADHAPTALLAARGRKVALAVTGGAFCVPPPVSPTPNMRHWVNVPAQRLANSDEAVLRVINSVLPSATRRLGALHEIFDRVNWFFNGVPELDPFGPRDPSSFLGLNSGAAGSALPQWPEREGPRIFAYLNSDYRHIEATLAALAASGASCVIYLLGATPAIRQKYQGSNLVFSADLLDIDRAVTESNLCLCHGNFGTVVEVLRRGKPLLLLPMDLEKFLTASSVERIGAGRLVHPESPHPDIAGALAHALQTTSLAEAARAFALKHREPSVDTITASAARRIEALAQGQPE